MAPLGMFSDWPMKKLLGVQDLSDQVLRGYHHSIVFQQPFFWLTQQENPVGAANKIGNRPWATPLGMFSDWPMKKLLGVQDLSDQVLRGYHHSIVFQQPFFWLTQQENPVGAANKIGGYWVLMSHIKISFYFTHPKPAKIFSGLVSGCVPGAAHEAAEEVSEARG
jgi:hypothetical protein